MNDNNNNNNIDYEYIEFLYSNMTYKTTLCYINKFTICKISYLNDMYIYRYESFES